MFMRLLDFFLSFSFSKCSVYDVFFALYFSTESKKKEKEKRRKIIVSPLTEHLRIKRSWKRGVGDIKYQNNLSRFVF